MDSTDPATRSKTESDDADQREGTLVGRVLGGRYRIVRRLGRGGMGAVYEAEHLELATKVAVKILQPSLSIDEKHRKRFLREARAASSIESDHIVRSMDSGSTDDGLLYFAMERMEGQDLEQYLHDNSCIGWARFEPILLQVIEALRAAHKRGVIHRDIKPANCFLCKTEAWPPLVKVLDFGIAKINASLADGESPVATLETLTATNELFGTVAYMAPELIEGHPADARTDIYALGVMMFRALTGQLPFKSPNVYKLLQEHVATPVPSLRTLQHDVPAEVESVVFRALAKRPEHRYQSVDELEAAIAAASEGVVEPSATGLSGHTEAVNPRPPSAADSVTAASASVSRRVDDRAASIPARARAPRFPSLAVFGLVLAVSSGTVALVLSVIDSPAPVSPATEPQASPDPAEPPALSRVAPTPEPPLRANAEDEHAEVERRTEVIHDVGATAAPEPAKPDLGPGAPTATRPSEVPVRKRPASPAATLDALAAKRCPSAIGERFTIEGVLNSRGKYIDPDVSGGSKASRACIDAFIRTRSFGEGRTMEPHTVRLVPR